MRLKYLSLKCYGFPIELTEMLNNILLIRFRQQFQPRTTELI